MDKFSALLKSAVMVAPTVDAVLADVQEAAKRSAKTVETLSAIVEKVPFLLDWGKYAEVYDLAESLVKQAQSAGADGVPSEEKVEHPTVGYCLMLLRTYLAHMDLARKRAIESRKVFLETLLEMRPLRLRAHAKSGLGLISLYGGDIAGASSLFKEAEELFRADNQRVDALKMLVRRIMVLRIEQNQEAALELSERGLLEGLEIGVDAIVPVTYLYSCVGSSLIEMGKKFEALRRLRDSAKLSKSMPPSIAGAFAMFQYGSCLAELDRYDEAISWLESADAWQRPRDPVARFATQVVLLKCFKEKKDWDRALPMARSFLTSTWGDVDDDDLEEAYETALQVFFLVHAQERINSFIEFVDLMNGRRRADSERQFAFRTKVATLISSYRDEWAGAEVFPPTSSAPATEPATPIAMFVDMAKGCMITHFLSQNVKEFLWRRASVGEIVMQELMSAVASGKRHVAKRQLIDAVVRAKPDGGKVENTRRQVDRVLAELADQRVISIEGSVEERTCSLSASARVTLVVPKG